MTSVKASYSTTGQTIDFQDEESLLEALISKKVPIDHSCEGMASCGTCRILVAEGLESLPPRNALEQEMAEDRQFAPKERLACQLCPTANLSFRLPKDPTP